MLFRQYIRQKWRIPVSVMACFFVLGMAELVLMPYIMDRWSHDRRIGILHILLGAALFLAGITGLMLLYRREYIRHGRNWKEELVRLLAGCLAIQCIAGTVTGIAGVMLYRLCRMPYEHVKTVLYVLNTVWQNLFRTAVVYYMVKRLYGRDWRKDYIEAWRRDQKENFREHMAACAGAAALTGLLLPPDVWIWRMAALFVTAAYFSVFAVYRAYKETIMAGEKQDEEA